MKPNKVKCHICGTEFEGEDYDECPYCCWVHTGMEDFYSPDEKEDCNLMSINEAKRLVASGKNIWGDPLPKKQ